VSDDDERARAIALLEANHKFPTEYSFTVIANNADEITVLVIEAAFQDDDPAEERPAGAHEVRPSAGGKYVSHRLRVRVVDAHHVLRIYARLRAVDGVRTIL
jgi:putative lipoic acid-binding regulatory protein